MSQKCDHKCSNKTKPHSFVNSSLIKGICTSFVSGAEVMFWKISWRGNHIFLWIRSYDVWKHQAPKTENKNISIIKPWIPIIGPKIIKELRKTTCKVIFTSATKLNKILCNNKSKLMSNSYPKLSSDCGEEIHWRNKNMCVHAINWTSRKWYERKMGSTGYNWTFQRLLWAV